jgi:TolB protein
MAAAGPAAARTDAPANAAGRSQTTLLISRAVDGGTPNGPSTNAVISNDKRYTRVIAFESEATNLVKNDRNAQKDVFAVLRSGANNKGTAWRARKTILVSRTKSGKGANGPSFNAVVGGGFHAAPRCVGFLSDATNIVPGDTNGATDAFVAKLGRKPVRVSKPGGKQSKAPVTSLTVSANCKKFAFTTSGKLYAGRVGGRAKRVKVPGTAADPSFSSGIGNDLVVAGRSGIYLLKNARGHAKLVGRGGHNPVYNDVKRHTVAYEKAFGGDVQIAYHDLGKREKVISSYHGRKGNGDSTKPVIGNSGYYVTFESTSSNLGTSASGRSGDNNDKPDVYLYSDTRKLTLVESVQEKSVPLDAGGANPSMSYYANYILFDTPSQLSSGRGDRQIFMRYLGGI